MSEKVSAASQHGIAEKEAKRDVFIRLPFPCSQSILAFQAKLVIRMPSIFTLEGLFLLSQLVVMHEKCVK